MIEKKEETYIYAQMRERERAPARNEKHQKKKRKSLFWSSLILLLHYVRHLV